MFLEQPNPQIWLLRRNYSARGIITYTTSLDSSLAMKCSFQRLTQFLGRGNRIQKYSTQATVIMHHRKNLPEENFGQGLHVR